MVAGGAHTRSLLIYAPDAREAAAYAGTLERSFPMLHLDQASDPEAARRLLPCAHALLVWRLPPALYPLAERVEWIQALGAGVDEVLDGWRRLVAAIPAKSSVPVTNLHAGFAGRVAEYVAGTVLAHVLRLPDMLHAQRRHEWTEVVPERLEGKRVGVAGLGTIGTHVARVMHALGARVAGWKRRPAGSTRPPFLEALYCGPDGLDALLRTADVLVITLPRTPLTVGLLGDAELRQMKEGAYLVNVGRGGIVDEQALMRSLTAGRLSGAVLDVFGEEPLPASSPLWDAPNLIVTPHVAGQTVPDEALPEILDNVGRYLRGDVLRNVVDPLAGY